LDGYILCVGEILYDFLSKEKGRSVGESVFFEKRPGGSPFNIAVALSRLGLHVDFMGVVGEDSFGRALIGYLKEEGVETSYLKVEKGAKTILAFASIDEDGKPDFEIYRDAAKELSLLPQDVESIDVEKFSAFHFGSISLLIESMSDAIIGLFRIFREKTNALTFLDPNIRPSFISDRDTFLRMMSELIQKTDVLKLSDEDLCYLTGERDVESGLRALKRDSITFVTLGRKGCIVSMKGDIIYVPAFDIDAVETTGCGDAFMAGVIYQLHNIGRGKLDTVSIRMLKEIAKFSNAAAAIVATRYGAAVSMPTVEEVQELLQGRSK